MINTKNAQVVRNISMCRPANGGELANLVNKGWLLMNYASRNNDGRVWIDLTDKAEEEFEIGAETKFCTEDCINDPQKKGWIYCPHCGKELLPR
jgi:hypothetical protein